MAKNKTIAPEVLNALVDAKVVEQLPWKELPVRYQELTGKKAGWRTIHRWVLDEIGNVALPDRVSKGRKDQVTNAFETTNALTLAMDMMVGTYQEWRVLYERHFRSMAVTEADRADEDVEGRSPIPLTEQELKRMDQLRKEIVSFFLTGVASLKKAQIPNDLFQQTFGGGAAVNTSPSPTASYPGGTRADAAMEETWRLLEDLNERHKKERIGYHRPLTIDEDELDLAEDD